MKLAKRQTKKVRSQVRVSPVNSSKAARTIPMFQLKRILVPVDFSDCSRKALHYAIPLARQFGAELILLHVFQPYVPVAEMGLMEVESTDDVQKDLQALQATLGGAVPSDTLVRLGNPHTEIISAARELGIDLIILSTHGRTGLEHVLLGSTAEKVVRHAGCPVLIVREHERDFVVDADAELAERTKGSKP